MTVKKKNSIYLLKLHSYHLSEERARNRVVEILESIGLQEPPNGWHTATLLVNSKNPIPILELVKEMRLTGIIERIQKDKDRADPIFGGTLSLASNNKNIGIGVKHGDFEAHIPGPGLIYPIDKLIAEDILYYRKSTCEYSNETELISSARYFSSYIFYSVTMIEYFMNRNLSVASLNPANKNAVQEVIDYRGRFDGRVNKWLQLFTGKQLSHISSSVEWSHFMRLKDMRNELIHGTKPYFAFSIKDMAEYLNYVQKGIGGLMKLIRDLQKLPSLTFIERLRTAPKVEFISH